VLTLANLGGFATTVSPSWRVNLLRCLQFGSRGRSGEFTSFIPDRLAKKLNISEGSLVAVFMHFRLWLPGLILISTTGLPAQQPAVPAFRISADLVTIDAVVTDGDGRHVTDLTATDFEVTVAGKKQELQQAVYIRTADQPGVLAAANADAPVPASATAGARSGASLLLKRSGRQPDRIARTVALVVDDLGLSLRGTVDARTMLHRYVDTQMESGDVVAIVRTGGGTGALQQFTTDKRLLHRAADAVQWSFRSRVSSFRAVEPTGLVGDVDDSAAGELRDATASVGSLGALEYIAHGIAELPGRKCIIFVSEGFTQLFVDRRESGRMWRAMTRMLRHRFPGRVLRGV